jgi:hypothetical protein
MSSLDIFNDIFKNLQTEGIQHHLGLDREPEEISVVLGRDKQGGRQD